MVNENVYAKNLRDRICEQVPNVVKIFKNDEQQCQGIPDHTILFNDGRYAMLEVKKSIDAKHQPNQDYYVEMFNNYGYAAFVYPENEKEIIRQLIDYSTRPNLEW
jgi:hypothetical protein